MPRKRVYADNRFADRRAIFTPKTPINTSFLNAEQTSTQVVGWSAWRSTDVFNFSLNPLISFQRIPIMSNAFV